MVSLAPEAAGSLSHLPAAGQEAQASRIYSDPGWEGLSPWAGHTWDSSDRTCSWALCGETPIWDGEKGPSPGQSTDLLGGGARLRQRPRLRRREGYPAAPLPTRSKNTLQQRFPKRFAQHLVTFEEL